MTEKCEICGNETKQLMICAECQDKFTEINKHQAAAIKETLAGRFENAVKEILECVRKETQDTLMQHEPSYPYNEVQDK